MPYEQMDLFESLYDKPSLPKEIRLIEFFGGIGAQAKAIEILGLPFEHWRVAEWSIHSIIAYNAIHMKDFTDYSEGMDYEDVLKAITGVSADYNKPMTEKQLRKKGEKWARRIYSSMQAIHDFKPNIMDVHADDLGIVDKDKYTYLMCYSFPCQDLSLAGSGAGYKRGSGTRSGLLWEVERILLECNERGCLPQCLLMENVPQVHSKSNSSQWNEWLNALHRLGYTNYFRDLNAKDFCIPQNRERTFMVSILGQASFSFPGRMPLPYVLKGFIADKVDKKYYLKEEQIRSFLLYNKRQANSGNGFKFDPNMGEGVSKAILTKAGQRACDNYIGPSLEGDEMPAAIPELSVRQKFILSILESNKGEFIDFVEIWESCQSSIIDGIRFPEINGSSDAERNEAIEEEIDSIMEFGYEIIVDDYSCMLVDDEAKCGDQDECKAPMAGLTSKKNAEKMEIAGDYAKTITATIQRNHFRDNTYVLEETE